METNQQLHQVSSKFEIFNYPTYPEPVGTSKYSSLLNSEDREEYLFVPSKRIPELVDSLLASDAGLIGDMLYVLAYYTAINHYSMINNLAEPGFELERPEPDEVLTLDEIVGIKLIEKMASIVEVVVMRKLYMARLSNEEASESTLDRDDGYGWFL